jgi:hypothetical protein
VLRIGRATDSDRIAQIGSACGGGAADIDPSTVTLSDIASGSGQMRHRLGPLWRASRDRTSRSGLQPPQSPFRGVVRSRQREVRRFALRTPGEKSSGDRRSSALSRHIEQFDRVKRAGTIGIRNYRKRAATRPIRSRGAAMSSLRVRDPPSMQRSTALVSD